jgi:hypothetical protein
LDHVQVFVAFLEFLKKAFRLADFEDILGGLGHLHDLLPILVDLLELLALAWELL